MPSPQTLQSAQRLVEDGQRLLAQRRLDAAQAKFEAAARLVPAAANPVHNLATIAQLRGDLAAAEAGFRRALALEPGRPVSLSALGSVLLGQGRFAEGFPLYDNWRRIPGREAKAAPPLTIPPWRGEDLAGRRVLIWSEEGFGDQIMFARYAARLRDLGARVSWLCPPPLVRLFAEGLRIEAIPAAGEVKLGAYDFYSPSSALPVLFDGAVSGAPYLAPPPAIRQPGLTVGVVTHGNPKHPHDAARSIPPEQRAGFLALPGAVDLQPEATGARDFHDTAAIIAGLDLVISVDTAVAHLAGALGKPVWVLPYAPEADWRWMQHRQDSPWYDTARLFRQPSPGDWTGVLAELVVALAAR